VWTQTQLEQLGKTALKQRAMDIRDAGGAEGLPPMPRHPDLLVPWILQSQGAMSRAGSEAGSRPASRPQGGGGQGYGGQGGGGAEAQAQQMAQQQYEMEQQYMQEQQEQYEQEQQQRQQQQRQPPPQQQQRGQPQYQEDARRGGPPSDAGSDAPSEAISNYNNAKLQRMAAIQRARGSDIFGT